jgi:PAS domain S-box-containing protein
MTIQYVNDAFTELTGYSAEEVLGRHVGFMSRSGAHDRARRFTETVVDRGQLWQQEVVAQRKDGRLYDAVLTISPMHDAENNLIGFVASHRDVSQERELERARNTFMTHVSHQLRTPVTNLKLYAQMLKKGVPAEKADHYLDVLEDQALRLSGLVQDILEMTAVDSGQAVRTWEQIPLSTLVQDTVNHFQERARAAGTTLKAEPLPPDLPAIYGDQRRLGQALGEVVENAVLFTPAGGTITISTSTAEASDRSWVTIAVKDTGPGISAEEQEFVFDRFFRGKLTESGHTPGSGLGLSLAQEIVAAHGGRLTVESDSVAGLGSTFTFWLLAADDEE